MIAIKVRLRRKSTLTKKTWTTARSLKQKPRDLGGPPYPAETGSVGCPDALSRPSKTERRAWAVLAPVSARIAVRSSMRDYGAVCFISNGWFIARSMHGGEVPHAFGRTARALSHPQTLGRKRLQELRAAGRGCLQPVFELFRFQNHHHALLIRGFVEQVHQGMLIRKRAAKSG